mgnify:CR=1 FL=1
MNLVTIFVVDDYLLTRIAFRQYFLNDNSFKLLGDFSNAKDCIRQLEKIKPDVILMDLELTSMNGLEATKIIAQKYPDIKIIIHTSYNSDERILGALSAGASGYFLKKDYSNIKKIIKFVVEEGNFYIDLELAKSAFTKIPPGNICDLENIYEYQKLKNSLTQRELEVLRLMTEGKTNSQIADEIVVSTNTAKAHVGNILTKLSVKDRVQAVVKAIKANLF